MQIDKNTLQLLRVEIDAALASIVARHELGKLTAGNATYDREGNFTFKLEGAAKGAKSREAQEYDATRAF